MTDPMTLAKSARYLPRSRRRSQPWYQRVDALFAASVGLICLVPPGYALSAAHLPVTLQELRIAEALVPRPKEAKNPLLDGITDDLLAQDRPRLLQAIDYSIKYIQSPAAARRYPIAGITRDRMERSLLRFQRLVQTAKTATDLQQAVAKEFDVYESIGFDGRGTVQFTGYYEAIYEGSRVRTAEYQYPLYRVPPDFRRWERPHPTRAQLENGKRLAGLEVVWLKDRLQAFLVHVQGSAQILLPDGQRMTVGFGGKTDQPYTSIGAELVRDGKMRLADVTLQTLIEYFKKNPQELPTYLQRNRSFVFFNETNGRRATGSLNYPVTAERSIATDKSIMPAGGLALIQTEVPFRNPQTNALELRPVSRFVLDHDTGGAIKGAGRVDIFMGSGEEAKQRAGLIKGDGKLFYLVLRN